MTKLCQLIAIANNKKSQATAQLTKVYHALQKAPPFAGLTRVYKPINEEGEQLPPEAVRVQMTVAKAIAEAREALQPMFDVVAEQDVTNCMAKADVVVDGVIIAKQLPVSNLLFLEKRLKDISDFVEKLPTLDPAQAWAWDSNAMCYATPESQTVRTKKVPKAFTKAEATDKHPAQVDVFQEDILVGHWTKKEFSGAIPAEEKDQMLKRVRKLQDAVKFAREEANLCEVVSDAKYGDKLLGYIFSAK